MAVPLEILRYLQMKGSPGLLHMAADQMPMRQDAPMWSQSGEPYDPTPPTDYTQDHPHVSVGSNIGNSLNRFIYQYQMDRYNARRADALAQQRLDHQRGSANHGRR